MDIENTSYVIPGKYIPRMLRSVCKLEKINFGEGTLLHNNNLFGNGKGTGSIVNGI